MRNLLAVRTRKSHRPASAMFLAVGLAALTGCFGTLPTINQPQANLLLPHSVYVDNDGTGRVPPCSAGVNCPAKYDAQLHLMMDSLRRSGRHRILLRIHGGLNAMSSSLTSSEEMLRQIQNDRPHTDSLFPIFINWESGIPSAYTEHLLRITQGQRYPTLARGLVSPVYLAADLGRGITRAPFVWGQQVRNFYSTRRPPDNIQVNDDGLRRSIGGYKRSRGASVLYYTQGALLFPLKAVEAVLVDALGTPGWDNMHRRTKVMFRAPNEFSQRTKTAPLSCGGKRVAERSASSEGYSRPTGAVSVLLDSLKCLVVSDARYRITLIGHSMGAIVANEIVRMGDTLPFDQIIFMAAASSVREFELATLPYLRAHPATQFYNLTLHPLADRRELTLLGFGPNGSLLEWVDAYLSNPESDADRVMGKYVNVYGAEHIFEPRVRAQMHVRAFGDGDGRGCGPKKREPYHHGGFNDPSVPFWHSDFWQPVLAPCPS